MTFRVCGLPLSSADEEEHDDLSAAVGGEGEDWSCWVRRLDLSKIIVSFCFDENEHKMCCRRLVVNYKKMRAVSRQRPRDQN